ncbi:peroxisomal leader peptide-processing protease isoform X1 [Scleropages formosus]|uniref:Peroxisomal leader peptide-processing protease n=1 Tax=Scleropages formosus TaxID=113540 RepID=A0A8C9R5Z6_SCLFO|nr:peroxisomal leader peptide-processing protease isoform X1 [Scleropages formosus]
MSAVETCCVVTVFESLQENRDESGSDSLQTPRLPPAHKCLSCTGVMILNDDRGSGIVLCSGPMFSHFLISKENTFPDRQFLLRDRFSNKLEIYVQHTGKAVVPAINHDCEKIVRTCSKLYKQQNIATLKAELIMVVNCVEFRTAFLNLFKQSDKWKFYSSEGDCDLTEDCAFLSWFAVLGVPHLHESKHEGHVRWESSCVLERGWEVFACGSPFGSLCPDLFMSTLSKGIVSNLAGEDHALILTDARCLPGTEGGGLFLRKGDCDFLVGVIVSPLCWKAAEWIGLTLVCSFHLILKNVVQSLNLCSSLRRFIFLVPTPLNEALPRKGQSTAMQNFPVVVLVDSGKFWGSAIVLSSQLIMTCRHVLNGKTGVIVRYKMPERLLARKGDVLYATKFSSPFDVAIVRLKEHLPDIFVPTWASSYKPGEDVYVIGHGVFGENCGPSVTSGILSRVIESNCEPVMLQTTCAVQAGASGGAVVRAATGELLGLVTSNTRDFVAEVTYPHLNFSIPAAVLEPLLHDFSVTGDPKAFKKLDEAEDGVVRVWRLQNKPQQFPDCKL